MTNIVLTLFTFTLLTNIAHGVEPSIFELPADASKILNLEETPKRLSDVRLSTQTSPESIFESTKNLSFSKEMAEKKIKDLLDSDHSNIEFFLLTT